ncbi:cobalamin-binding protein [Planctomicrobium sp. SH661]|uniref:cobalamin-binding protein n=1 Tax=Planctomicrobium sp. SH661 TaxID=3448124 RepID=UPI003F5BDDA1
MSHRIVSLIPSGTEIVSALGFADQLVGRSHECDFPPAVQALTVCSKPRIDLHADSLEIDRQVRASLANALSIYEIFTEELGRLAPTHIVTQSQCEVCAVSLKEVQEAVCELVDSHPQIISLSPMNLSDLWNDIRRTATALGAPERGDELVIALQLRLDSIRTSVSRDKPAPRVFCLEWIDPLMSAGNWVPELVEIAGGVPLLCEAGKHSPYLDWHDVLTADPDVIVVMPCGFDISRTVAELKRIESHPAWNQLRAVRNGHVYLTDGNQYFNRPGPRVVESAQILAEIFTAMTSPDKATFQHRGSGWISLAETM